jgi:hypothetical protein
MTTRGAIAIQPPLSNRRAEGRSATDSTLFPMANFYPDLCSNYWKPPSSLPPRWNRRNPRNSPIILIETIQELAAELARKTAKTESQSFSVTKAEIIR